MTSRSALAPSRILGRCSAVSDAGSRSPTRCHLGYRQAEPALPTLDRLMWALRPVARGRRHRSPPRPPAALSSLLGCSTLDVETAPRGRRNFFTRVSHEPGTIPAMTDETNTRDLKASEDAELHFLRSIEVTLDDIARDIAEMKAEARHFLTAHELSRETAPRGSVTGIPVSGISTPTRPKLPPSRRPDLARAQGLAELRLDQSIQGRGYPRRRSRTRYTRTSRTWSPRRTARATSALPLCTW